MKQVGRENPRLQIKPSWDGMMKKDSVGMATEQSGVQSS